MELSKATRAAQHIGSVSNLAAYLRAINGHVDGGITYLFRGQRHEQWLLEPSIARHPRVWTHTEQEMLQDFKERAVPHLESTVDLRDAGWLAIAQHHPMPTRLLDWSGSALVALWFAIHQSAELSNGRKRATGAAVCVLRYSPKDMITGNERSDPLAVARTPLFKPRYVSRRIATQDG